MDEAVWTAGISSSQNRANRKLIRQPMARCRSASRRECRFLGCRVKNVDSPLPLACQRRGQRSKPVLVDGRSRPLAARRRETYPRARARAGQRQLVDDTPSTVSYVRARRSVVPDPQTRSRSSASAEAPALLSLAVFSVSGTSGHRTGRVPR